MASKIVFDETAAKMEHDLEIFEKQVVVFIRKFKSDSSKTVLPAMCT